MKLTARHVGKLFVGATGRPMIYQGTSDAHFLFIYRDPPRDRLAYREDQLWMLERYQPAAAPTVPKGVA